MAETLNYLSRMYVNWIFAGYGGGGYIADKNRVEVHEDIAEKLGVEPEELDYLLSNLDRWIGLPLDVSMSPSFIRIVHEYGDRLEKLLEDMPDQSLMASYTATEEGTR